MTKQGRRGAKKRSFISLMSKNNRIALCLQIGKEQQAHLSVSSRRGNESQQIVVPKEGYYHRVAELHCLRSSSQSLSF